LGESAGDWRRVPYIDNNSLCNHNHLPLTDSL